MPTTYLKRSQKLTLMSIHIETVSEEANGVKC